MGQKRFKTKEERKEAAKKKKPRKEKKKQKKRRTGKNLELCNFYSIHQQLV